MKAKDIKSIPKHILSKILAQDLKDCPTQKGPTRIYSYLTSIKNDLVKITVAVKTYRGKQYAKQVAVHGVKSNLCFVRDMEYNYLGKMGYRIGWHAEGLYNHKKWYEDGSWCTAKSKYYNFYSTLINFNYVARFPQYRYSAWQLFKDNCIIKYLKIYEQYPQVEYLMKLGLDWYHDSVMVLKKIAKDKRFCKWLILNKQEISSNCRYVTTLIHAYKYNKPIKQTQDFLELKKMITKDSNFSPITRLFKFELEQLFSYLDKQKSTVRTYLDYLNACNYLKLDMGVVKNMYPHNFKHWHDVRIDEYHSAKALADEKQRAEFYKQFSSIAEKYEALQKRSSNGYAIIIANSPAELLKEGTALEHCVGKMGYDQKFVRQDSLIFFVREQDKLDTPLITIEYSPKSKKILQCYGHKHSKPNETISNFINKIWLPFANKQIKKLQLKEDAALKAAA